MFKINQSKNTLKIHFFPLSFKSYLTKQVQNSFQKQFINTIKIVLDFYIMTFKFQVFHVKSSYN